MAIIVERFINILRDNAVERDKYRSAVWDILQYSYAPIGGIKGSGFANPEDMDKIPFWKLATKDGVVKAVIMYKEKNGRKSVALGSDGSDEGKSLVKKMVLDDLTQSRAYSESSKASLACKLRIFGDELESILIDINTAERVMGEVVLPISDVPQKDWPDDARVTISKWPVLEKYGYLREIGNDMVFKVMLGTPYRSIFFK